MNRKDGGRLMDTTESEKQEPDTKDSTPDLIDGHSLDEWRELGSAEANAWSITPPGGETTTLNGHAAEQARIADAEEAERQAAIGRFDEMLNDEADERASAKQNVARVAASDDDSRFDGSSELAAMTFILPDGTSGSLSEMAAHSQAQTAAKLAEDQEARQAVREELEGGDRLRKEKAQRESAQNIARAAVTGVGDTAFVPPAITEGGTFSPWTDDDIEQLSQVGPEDVHDALAGTSDKLRDLNTADDDTPVVDEDGYLL